ncbi:MAG: alpha-2-macroglobulin [Planctomycetales bacterium]|nr:alpha-2-macroglobulin [Planctomycetales bacterium]
MSVARGMILLAACGILAVFSVTDRPMTAAQQQDMRARSQKLMRDGNFKDALEGFQKLCLDTNTDGIAVGQDLSNAVMCQQRLGLLSEFDKLVESTVERHADSTHLLQQAAQLYMNTPHYGMIVANEFQRGGRRGGGKMVNAWERDRVRALQLMEQGLTAAINSDDKGHTAGYLRAMADLLLANRGPAEAWRLQYLTDLSQLPDYEDGYGGYRQSNGAPVDKDGNPVFHHASKTWDAAENDGQRWRWALEQVVENDPQRRNEVLRYRAEFLHGQFGVHTMQQHIGPMFGRGGMGGGMDGPIIDEGKQNETGPYAVSTLKDTETIARLATGIKRFDLPDEFNFIKLWEQTGDDITSLRSLASVYQNRRQLPKAAEKWRRVLKVNAKDDGAKLQLSQIVDSWGRFEPTMSKPVEDQGTQLYLRFRNGNAIDFTAQAIDRAKLLGDVKTYLKSNPGRVDYQKVNYQGIGYRLLQGDGANYLTGEKLSWSMKLDPPEQHLDSRVTVQTPIKEAGAYWLTAKMKDGNNFYTLLWIEDTAIVRKQLSEKNLYYVADARTGKPVEGATVEFFGYKQERVTGRIFKVTTSNFAERTTADGTVFPDSRDLQQDHQWLVTATQGDRFATFGFSGVYTGRYYDQEYNQTKPFGITDRPVYRPGDKVGIKVWVRHAQYDQDNVSQFAGRSMEVKLFDPKGQELRAETLTADEYGGIVTDLELKDDATLGVYSVRLEGIGQAVTFRVEEYKKPEYEVLVDAPKEPVMLGEKVRATVKAKYYFGAPVTEATAKIKVMREEKLDDWFPVAPWDWCYGPGYWWFCYDTPWYPGFGDWVGCRRPIGWWFPAPRNPPELVMEFDAEVDSNGEVQFDIDTQVAKEFAGDKDHRYTITAEVRDQSRRTIVGTGNILVARKPFKVYTWLNRGYYEVGDAITAYVKAQTPDRQPVTGTGVMRLYQVSYNEQREPSEKLVGQWDVDTDAEGRARRQMTAAAAGQYRLAYELTDPAGHRVEGGYLFTIIGTEFKSGDYRFNELELIPDQPQYAPGDTVKLQINTDLKDSTVLLFVRPANGVYLPPKVIRMQGKSIVEEIAVIRKDMPNFFVEAMTIADGNVYTEMKEIVVPPEKRVLNVEVTPSAEEYLPGEEATVQVRLTDHTGENFVGTTALAIYDKSVEYVSGGSNVPDIREYFWKWRRHHNPSHQTNLAMTSHSMTRPGEMGMSDIGVFGGEIVETRAMRRMDQGRGGMGGFGGGAAMEMADGLAMNAAPMMQSAKAAAGPAGPGGEMPVAAAAEPVVRSNFADTALWVGVLETDSNGLAKVKLNMPENLTTWKVRVWGMGHGTKVGAGEAEVITRKNLIVRLQAPRFFVETDEVVLSANVHNYLANAKNVSVALETEGPLELVDPSVSVVQIPANGEQRVDWRVKVTGEGQATVRMKAVTDEESDAVEMKFPAYVHGALRTEAWAGTIRPEEQSSKLAIQVPSERRVEESVLEIRYSPTLAGAMVDALPYLADYPHGCTEQTLNRFMPAVITQKVLREMGLNLGEIQAKRTNLNAQEIGADVERAKQWKRFDRNPVFDEAELSRMVRDGLKMLANMQLDDGGWGWFSGYGERSFPHTTAVVVHGLQVAAENDTPLVPGMLERGLEWLKRYQQQEAQKLRNADGKVKPWKNKADNLDAMVYMILSDADMEDAAMRDFLYRDRVELSVYAKAMIALAYEKHGHQKQLDMMLQNIKQYLVVDEENETAYLRLAESSSWWYWYGSETEANAYYLKLLSRVEPKGTTAPRLVKYLLNNRKHATYWNSTRDTALCVEAFSEFIRATGEMQPDMVVEVWVDGQKRKEVAITGDNLFTFDNKFLLTGDQLTDGSHEIEIRRSGKGPVYFNTYLTNFSLEKYIKRAGLEVRVNRKFYRLVPEEKTIKAQGSQGQVGDQRVEKYRREELADLAELKSGELVDVELEIDSKNDYEYVLFEDMKAAGFEPMEVQSGYRYSGLRYYIEFRDNRVAFFMQQLPRGKHSVSYRLRAEIPGQFSALPARAEAMYAPELRGNSDEIKLRIVD